MSATSSSCPLEIVERIFSCCKITGENERIMLEKQKNEIFHCSIFSSRRWSGNVRENWKVFPLLHNSKGMKISVFNGFIIWKECRARWGDMAHCAENCLGKTSRREIAKNQMKDYQTRAQSTLALAMADMSKMLNRFGENRRNLNTIFVSSLVSQSTDGVAWTSTIIDIRHVHVSLSFVLFSRLHKNFN